MTNKNLVDVFNVKKRTVVTQDVTDYEVFPDKVKLEELRTKIIQNLIDNTIPKNLSLEQYINDEIDDTLQDYDLEPLERNHIFNLIQNEISGYGPLTELLENDSYYCLDCSNDRITDLEEDLECCAHTDREIRQMNNDIKLINYIRDNFGLDEILVHIYW